jgi:hypothetical protein
MINPEYDREFVFDIDEYLIEWYPSMSMAIRRSICRLAIDELDDELLHETVDVIVAEFALDKQGLTKKEEPEEEDD